MFKSTKLEQRKLNRELETRENVARALLKLRERVRNSQFADSLGSLGSFCDRYVSARSICI